ncbi:MAG TPA: hypothetical protein VFY29_04215 [Terriglobia bacterium]|nr:hypothetical protein [Terriglobia bacterium]
MNRMSRIAIAILTVSFAAAGVASGQSLADLARQERERKKNMPEATVITNEALPKSAPRPVEPPPSEQATKPAEPASDAKPGAKPAETGTDAKPGAKPAEDSKHDEAWWRAAFAEARADLKRAESERQALELQVAQANKDFLVRDDLFNKEGQMTARLNGLNADLEAARGREANARQKIAGLEEDLRRSGGLPGWAR